jgi:transposase-like protein
MALELEPRQLTAERFEELDELELEALGYQALLKTRIIKQIDGRGRATRGNTKLTAELALYVCKLIEAGLNFTDASELAGISRNTFYKWRQTGETIENQMSMGMIDDYDSLNARDRDLHIFYHMTNRAIASKKLRLLRLIESHADKQWTAAAWMLERSHPSEFGQRMRIEKVDWRSELIQLIRDGLSFEVLRDEIGKEHAKAAFVEAGVPIDAGRITAGNSNEGTIDSEFN